MAADTDSSNLDAPAGLTDVDLHHQQHHEQSDLEVTYCHVVVEYTEQANTAVLCWILGHAG